MSDSNKKSDIANYIQPDNGIGLRIKSAREAKKLSQIDMHKKTGLSRTVLINYEAGRHSPGAREIKLICDALQISPNYLIYGAEAPHKVEEGLAGLIFNLGGNALIPLGLLLPVIASLFDRNEKIAFIKLMETLIKTKNQDIYNLILQSLKESPNEAATKNLTQLDAESLEAYITALRLSLKKVEPS